MDPRLLTLEHRTFLFRGADVAELLALRHAVLRQGLPFSEASFDGDDAPTTRHFGAFDGPAAVCCATFVQNTWEGEPAWQLRGMATAAGLRSLGVGGALLAYAEQAVLAEFPRRTFWCNARVGALDFYRRQGWQVVSELFEIPTAGPHRKMLKRA